MRLFKAISSCKLCLLSCIREPLGRWDRFLLKLIIWTCPTLSIMNPRILSNNLFTCLTFCTMTPVTLSMNLSSAIIGIKAVWLHPPVQNMWPGLSLLRPLICPLLWFPCLERLWWILRRIRNGQAILVMLGNFVMLGRLSRKMKERRELANILSH